MREPSQVFIQLTPTGELLSAGAGDGRWAAGGVQVRWSASSEVLVSASSGVSRVALRWDEAVPAGVLVLGDAWERSYGDLQWRHLQAERLLPWYWLAHDETTGATFGAGVDVQPGAFCSWTVDRAGFTLWLDLRNGGGPTQLGDRELTAAVVRRFEDAGTPWLTLHAAVEAMSSNMKPRDIGPVVGANNWYYAYGEGFDEKAVLQDAATVVELADGHPVKPFSVVDDGWNPGGNGSGGPWESGIPGLFDDLVKHDFSTYDLFGRFGPAMGARLTDDGWQFHDPTRTTAEIVLDLYREIRAAAQDVVLIGCNTVGHLAAGLVDMQRTGDDTSLITPNSTPPSFHRRRRLRALHSTDAVGAQPAVPRPGGQVRERPLRLRRPCGADCADRQRSWPRYTVGAQWW